MSAARPVRLEIDRAFDLRVLAALPPTLGLFAPAALQAQLREMTKHRRAICFTLLAPVSRRDPSTMSKAAPSISTVLVCLHVAPVLAGLGLDAILGILAQASATEADPVHELAAPLAGMGETHAGFYREAIYVEANTSIAITTHTPPQLPQEAMKAIAAVIREAPVDIVTTVAIAPWRAVAATLANRTAAPGATLH